MHPLQNCDLMNSNHKVLPNILRTSSFFPTINSCITHSHTKQCSFFLFIRRHGSTTSEFTAQMTPLSRFFLMNKKHTLQPVWLQTTVLKCLTLISHFFIVNQKTINFDLLKLFKNIKIPKGVFTATPWKNHFWFLKKPFSVSCTIYSAVLHTATESRTRMTHLSRFF